MVLIHQLGEKCSSPLPGGMNCKCHRELQKKFQKYSRSLPISQLIYRRTFYGKHKEKHKEKPVNEWKITVFLEHTSNVNTEIRIICIYLSNVILHPIKSIVIFSLTPWMLHFCCYILRSGYSASSHLWAKCLLSYISIARHPILRKQQEIPIAACRMSTLTPARENERLSNCSETGQSSQRLQPRPGP